MISFIIPAHNEEGLIGPTVAALHKAAAALDGAGPASDGYEIIVADDASTDRTGDEAAAAGARVLRVDKRQISAVRRAGAAEARGDILIFVDADTIVPPRAAAQAVAAIQSGAVGGGAGVTFDGWVPWYAHVMLWPTLVLFRLLRYTGGCFLFCTRVAYEATGGWSEEVYAGEEILMAHALKRHGRFVIIRTPVITSGRKLRTHSAGEVIGTMVRLLLKGFGGVKTRDGLEMWYGKRREDSPAAQKR